MLFLNVCLVPSAHFFRIIAYLFLSIFSTLFTLFPQKIMAFAQFSTLLTLFSQKIMAFAHFFNIIHTFFAHFFYIIHTFFPKKSWPLRIFSTLFTHFPPKSWLLRIFFNIIHTRFPKKKSWLLFRLVAHPFLLPLLLSLTHLLLHALHPALLTQRKPLPTGHCAAAGGLLRARPTAPEADPEKTGTDTSGATQPHLPDLPTLLQWTLRSRPLEHSPWYGVGQTSKQTLGSGLL